MATALGAVMMLFTLVLEFGNVPGMEKLFHRLELFVYNQRMHAHVPEEVEQDKRIVIVDIDEASLRAVGRWPWSRQKVGELVNRLVDSGAVVIALDILFAEAERNPAKELAEHLGSSKQFTALREQLAGLAPKLDADAAMATTLGHGEVLLGYAFSGQARDVAGALPSPLPLTNPELVSRLAMPAMRSYTGSVPVLQQAAVGGGFISLEPDIDGVVRRAPLINRYDDKLYTSLALETVRRYLFLQQATVVSKPINGYEYIERLRFDKTLSIPTDENGQILIPFRGHRGSFPYVSAQSVLSGEAPADLLAGAIVLVGTTAIGLYDLRVTPIDPNYPGVEVHANLISAMLDNRYLVTPSWSEGANLVFSVIVGLLLALLLPRLPLGGMLLLTGSGALAVIGVTEWFWVNEGLVLNLAGPLLLIAMLVVGNLVWGFFFESLTRLRLKGMFGQYVPPELVDEMSERPDEYDADEGRARELSVLFADIRGFTTLSESLSADDLKRFLNRFFTPMTRIIFNHYGTIDKYVGDMVMAFWGAPVSDEQHAVHAIEAALEMQIEVERLKHDFAAVGWPEVNIGIGINTGMMSVGDMGSEYRRSYTVLGDSVNLASRLEGTNKVYGTGILIGERTRELAGDYFAYREIDLIQVKGKAKAVRIFQPVCHRSKASEWLLQEIDMLEQALKAYRSRQWDEAETLFSELQSQQPDIPIYSLYSKRIAELRNSDLDPEWNGVFVRSEK